MTINPQSTAGILLREHDNPQQALAYAERKAALLAAMHNGVACDYEEAAKQIREHITLEGGRHD